MHICNFKFRAHLQYPGRGRQTLNCRRRCMKLAYNMINYLRNARRVSLRSAIITDGIAKSGRICSEDTSISRIKLVIVVILYKVWSFLLSVMERKKVLIYIFVCHNLINFIYRKFFPFFFWVQLFKSILRIFLLILFSRF